MTDVLPDNVLLEIFDAYRVLSGSSGCSTWQFILVNVCRRWHEITFASPFRLFINLHCTYGIHVKKFLGGQPAFPITIDYTHGRGIDLSDEDNLLAALELCDRLHHLCLRITDKQLANLDTVIQKPFPMLTRLQLSRKKWPELVLPRGFLGGFAFTGTLPRKHHFSRVAKFPPVDP